MIMDRVRSRIVAIVMVNLSMKFLRVSFSPYSMYFKVVDMVDTVLRSTNWALNMILKASK